jgi:hypothetical protein
MRRYARLGAYVASLTLAVTTVTAIAPSAQATPVKDPIGVNAGASWLESQLTNGLVHNKQFNFDDYGLTLDFGFALQAVGGHTSTVTAIKNAMASHVDDYVTPLGGPHSYTGGLAKLALFVGDPTDKNFGGQNLITQLEGRVSSTSPIAGRIEDAGFTPGDQFDDDSANVLGQAYAVAALHNAGSSNTSALTFLLQQQCPNGGFRLSFTASKTASDQSCTDNSQAQIDATSVTLIELNAIGYSGAAINSAETFLVGKQAVSGAWGGDPGGAAENANATGLAAWALGNTAQSAKGAAWLRDHQATFYDYCDNLKTNVGTVAYSDDTLNSGRVDGITPSSQDQFRRAAAQAVPGLQYLDADATPAAPQLSGPSGYQKSDSFVNFRVTGVHAGDQLCLTGGPGGARSVSTGTSAVIREVLPFGTAIRTFAVRDRDGHSDTTTGRRSSRSRSTAWPRASAPASSSGVRSRPAGRPTRPATSGGASGPGASSGRARSRRTASSVTSGRATP